MALQVMMWVEQHFEGEGFWRWKALWTDGSPEPSFLEGDSPTEEKALEDAAHHVACKRAEPVKTLFCTECNRQSRVTEENAFGRDPLRSTLSCGHVVTKPERKG